MAVKKVDEKAVVASSCNMKVTDLIAFLQKATEKYGPGVEIRIPGNEITFVTAYASPDAALTVG